MKNCFLCTVLCLFVSINQLAISGEALYPWQAAVAKSVITPKESIWMAGYAGRKGPSESVLQDIHAKALALEDAEGGRMVFITLDLIGIPKIMRVNIESAALKTNGLRPEQLLLNASHTHSGPMLGVYALPKGDGKLVPVYTMVPDEEKEMRAKQALEYRAYLEKEIGNLITETLAHLKPCTVNWSHARCGFSMNRRTPVKDGWKNFPNPDAPVDQEVPVLQIHSLEDKKPLIGVMFGYACHATTMGTMEMHGDWPGFAQTFFEEDNPGTVALFLNGASGDQNPYPRRFVRFLERHGRSMATAIEAALQTAPTPIRGPLRSAIAWPEIKYQAPPTREELVERSKSKNSWDASYGKFLLDTLDEKGSLPKSYPIPVQVVRFGDSLTLAAIGGEVVVDYALRLKKELGEKTNGAPVWFSGYSNEVPTYIPSRRVLEEGGYEGGGAMRYTRSNPHPAPWETAIEEILVGKAHALFDAL